MNAFFWSNAQDIYNMSYVHKKKQKIRFLCWMVGRLNSLSTDAVHKDGPAVTVTASVTHIRQVHFNQPVDGALVQSILGLVQMQSCVIQFSTRKIVGVCGGSICSGCGQPSNKGLRPTIKNVEIICRIIVTPILSFSAIMLSLQPHSIGKGCVKLMVFQ